MTKQNLYRSVEALFRIYFEFMAEYYGVRAVDMPPPAKIQQAAEFAGQTLPDEIPIEFDFTALKELPMRLKIDVGASSYYSEIASRQTLDNLLMNKLIGIEDYLERIPDSYIPRRRALISKIKQQTAAVNGGRMLSAPTAGDGGGTQGSFPTGAATGLSSESVEEKMEIPTGKGNGAMQRKINSEGSTQGVI